MTGDLARLRPRSARVSACRAHRYSDSAAARFRFIPVCR
jgi:hypothetical protein